MEQQNMDQDSIQFWLRTVRNTTGKKIRNLLAQPTYKFFLMRKRCNKSKPVPLLKL